MPTRVVLPRHVLCRQASQIMWRAWTLGYASRVVMTQSPTGWMGVEFLLVIDATDPEALEAFEMELDDTLAHLSIRSGFRTSPAQVSGSGVWTEAA